MELCRGLGGCAGRRRRLPRQRPPPWRPHRPLGAQWPDLDIGDIGRAEHRRDHRTAQHPLQGTGSRRHPAPLESETAVRARIFPGHRLSRADRRRRFARPRGDHPHRHRLGRFRGARQRRRRSRGGRRAGRCQWRRYQRHHLHFRHHRTPQGRADIPCPGGADFRRLGRACRSPRGGPLSGGQSLLPHFRL